MLWRELKVILVVVAVCLVERAWVWLRIKYLENRKEKITISFNKEVTLRYAIWAHFYQFVGVAFGVVFFAQVFSARNHIGAKYIYSILAIFVLAINIVTLIPRLKTRVVVGVGKQMFCFDGYRHETIYSGQVSKYYCNAYSYYITKTDGNISKIPASLKHGEIIMAFLEEAVAHHSVK
jgi:hypothetical protein